MHEFSLCEGIIKQVVRANHEQTDNLATVTIEVGKLAGVDIESLSFWFPVVAGKLNCPELQLQINEVDGRARCNSCNHDFILQNLYDPCPSCGTFGDYQIMQGREMLIKSFAKLP